jgi:cell division ATPase FtsA
MARIYDILVPRFEELLEEIDKVFAKAKRSRRLPGGVVFVGGVANTPGLAHFASDQLELHTRIGKLHHIGGLADTVKATDYAAAIGLMTLDGILSIDEMNTQSGMHQNTAPGMFTKIKNLIKK